MYQQSMSKRNFRVEKLRYSDVKQCDWILVVMLLVLANQGELIQHRIVTYVTLNFVSG